MALALWSDNYTSAENWLKFYFHNYPDGNASGFNCAVHKWKKEGEGKREKKKERMSEKKRETYGGENGQVKQYDEL